MTKKRKRLSDRVALADLAYFYEHYSKTTEAGDFIWILTLGNQTSIENRMDFECEDFELAGYGRHLGIKMPIAV